MREEQVANGVNFLVHPKVKTAPLSQRISFLENKGLTPEEISAALSRVEAGEGDLLSAAAGGDAGTSSPEGTLSPRPSPSPFPAEASVPLWRQVAVPGALVMGAVGALGTYFAASRSAERGGPNQSGEPTSHASTAAAGRTPYSSGGAGAGVSEPGGVVATGEDAPGYTDGAYAQERLARSQRLEGGGAAAFLPFDGGNGGDSGFHAGVADGPGLAGEASSLLAGEFRRLTETMEQQTGHMVEAVGAMKALASRAEQDSSSLLAARVSSHTSELRAELGTIKQLLLLQAGAEGGGAPAAGGKNSSAAIAAAASAAGNGGARAKAWASPKVAVGGAEHNGLGGGGVESSGAEGAKGATEPQVNGLGAKNGLPAKDLEEEKAKEAADKSAAEEAALVATGRRKDVARAALTALLADNAPQAAKDGIAMLRMLVANLVNQPNVPRYRRITTSNDNFKKRLLPLEGHRAMMEAVGFRAKGSLWEWTWHEDSGPSASTNNKAVLEDVVKAIDAVARPNGPPLSGATPTVPVTAVPATASASLTPPPATATAASTKQPPIGDGGTSFSETNGVARQSRFSDTAAAAAAAAAAVDAIGGGAVEGSDDKVSGAGADTSAGFVQSSGAIANDVLAAAAEVNGVGENACETVRLSGGVRAATTADGSVVEPSTGEESAVVAAAAMTPRDNSCGVDAATVEPGAPPASMAEVAAAIQRGDEPPGIRVVEDRLSVDAQSLAMPSQPSPPKPWEVFAGAAATGVMAAENRGAGEHAGDGVGNGRGYGSGEDATRPQHAVSVGP